MSPIIPFVAPATALFLGLAVVAPAPASATVIIVPTPSHPTIQSGVDAAVDGDQVWVLSGTYLESIEVGAAITLLGVGGAATTTIQGSPAFATVRLNAPGSRLEGFTITGGGHGVSMIGGVVENCVLEGNLLRGALIANAGSAALRGCAIRGNTGGIWVSTANQVTISDCLVSDNHTTGSGGGLLADFAYGSLTVERSTFARNSSTDGGAIAIWDEVNLTLVDTLLDGNESSGGGGAVSVDEFATACAVTRCALRGNLAAAGGGIFSGAAADVTTVADSLLCGNAPEHVAGAWTDAGGNTLLADCCPGDADASGAVGFPDLLAVLAAWGPCPGCTEDANADGAVDFDDLLIVLAAWGPCP